MPHVLIINAVVSLIMGAALVLVWRRDRTQTFTRYIGWANLMQLLVPMGYWLTAQPHQALVAWGFVMLPLAAACYTTLLTLGAAHLAGQPAPPRAGWLIFLLLALTDAAALALGGLQAARICVGAIDPLLGVLCAY